MTKMPSDNNMQLVAAGIESVVYRLSSPGMVTILKKRRQNGRTNYGFEACAYQRLGELGAHVPKVLFVDGASLHMSAFLGEELDDKTELYGNEQLMAAVASDLELCRDVQFDGFGHATLQKDQYVGEFMDWQSYLDSVSQGFLSPEVLDSGLLHSEIETLQAYWKRVQPRIQLDRGMLVHGDFAMSAIFVNNGTYEGIIDFGDAFIGDPLMDIAYFRFKEITKSYGDSQYKLLLQKYLAASHIQVENIEERIQFYMIYWALIRLRYCPDEQLRVKFIEKTRVLCGLLSIS